MCRCFSSCISSPCLWSFLSFLQLRRHIYSLHFTFDVFITWFTLEGWQIEDGIHDHLGGIMNIWWCHKCVFGNSRFCEAFRHMLGRWVTGYTNDILVLNIQSTKHKDGRDQHKSSDGMAQCSPGFQTKFYSKLLCKNISSNPPVEEEI